MTSSSRARAGFAAQNAAFIALCVATCACAEGLPGDDLASAGGGDGGNGGAVAAGASAIGVGGTLAGPGASVADGARGGAGGSAGSAGRVSAPAGAGGASAGTSGNDGSNPSGAGGASGVAGTGAMAGSGGSSSGASGGAIWMPKPGATWQWQLTGMLDTSLDVEMYDIDLFGTSSATIETLHGAGRVVVCYFSAGSYEPGRPDSAELMQTGLGSVLDGWPDEKWLDVRSSDVRELMKARLELAASKGCDGVEPDNVDGFDNDNGLGLTREDQLDYLRLLASEAHARGLSIGLKNSLDLVSSLVSSFDWSLNEECLQYDECDALQPFIAAGKAVFHCEYSTRTNGICGAAPEGFSTIIKNLDLDAFRLACP